MNNIQKQQHILVTGGSGYIGSHTTLSLLQQGFQVTVVDNLSNSHYESIKRVEQLAGKPVTFYQADVLDRSVLMDIFQQHQFDAVVHFAGLKSVGESVQNPLLYYHNNVQGTINLCQVMGEFGVRKLVFSSSAAVYGNSDQLPIRESDRAGQPISPYAQSKLMVEQILNDLHSSDSNWQITLLRYFNPVGAHESGLIGEDPNGVPNNIMPYISQVASGKLPQLSIFGADYDTVDGTGVRDFIHVMDLAEGHVSALKYLNSNPGLATINLGTGQGVSVKQLVDAFAKENSVDVPYEMTSRREGDIDQLYADVTLAKQLLGWQAKRNLEDMCRDAWRWQKQNPEGYVN